MEVPQNFVCPISHEIMQDPVMTPAGHTFERANIVEWLRMKRTCPVTRATLTIDKLAPNLALR